MTFSEWSKKKKKQEEETESPKTFTEWHNAKYGIEEEEDIAPVLTTTTKEYDEEEIKRIVAEQGKIKDTRSWFQKGLFKDGWQFGDVTKTILGSVMDAASDLGTGIIGMGEKAVDAIAYISPGLSQSQQAENNPYYRFDIEQYNQDKEAAEEFIAKDLYDEEEVAKKILSGIGASTYLSNKADSGGMITKEDLELSKEIRDETRTYIDEEMEEESVLGEKSDALVQSAGQLAGTAGLQMAGVPWWLTTGATSFGSEAESALNEGATYEEAGLSAAISAGAEILTEKISGGISFGGKTLDDALLTPFIRGISSKTARTLVKLGADATGEGFEELLSGYLSAIGQKMTYMDDKELGEIFTKEEAAESFVGGFFLGGVSGGVNAIKSNGQGIDYVSGLTANEQAVVDKVYNDEIAKQEQDGKKLTQREKSKIYDEVLEDMEKGYISTDTIEEVFGGDTYKSYKDTIDSEDALQQEFDTLNKMKQGEMTGEQIDRRAALKQQLDELKTTSQRNQLKSQLGDEVFGLVQNDRLVESYNERGRRSQSFEADLTQYDATQQETIKRAVESGILNNTNRTHEFVDMLAKMSADKGVLFDFTNNAKLKDSSFAVDGKAVNGFVTKDGITLNIDSAKLLNSVVGHEITHVLEGTELYDALKQTVFDYAKSKGEYDSRLASLTELYKDIKDADVDAELAADLVGDYLFSDGDFVKSLSVQHRNVFQKIYDEIKYLCKIATAGSKEARELERVKRAFEEAYKEGGEAQSGTKYSLEQIDGTGYVRAEKNIFLKEDGTMASERDIFNSLVGKTISLPDGDVTIVKNLPGKDMYNELSRRYPKSLAGVSDPKRLNTEVNHNMEELLTNSTAETLNEPDKGNKHAKQGITGFDTRTVKFYDGSKAYDIEFSIATLQNGEKVAYAKKFFGYDAELTKKIQATETGSNQSPVNQLPVSKVKVPQTEADVKYSLSDSNGKPQRAVGFDEVGVFVIPNNADVKLKQELLNRGYSIAEYDPNIEGHRQQVVNQFEEYKFSLSNVGEQFAPASRFDTFGRDIAKQDIAPVKAAPAPEISEEIAPVASPVKEAYEAITPKKEAQPKLAKATPTEQARAEVLVDEPKVEKNEASLWSMVKNNFIDKGAVFETMSLKTGNHELQGKFKSIGRADASAQWLMEHGNASTSSLKSIRDTVEKSGKTQQFYEYLYHLHNADRMTLEERYDDVENKPVFGSNVTAQESKNTAANIERANPEFKEYAAEVYDYMSYLREMLVDGGVISSETAKLWAEMYPHYVPIRRKGDEGLNINVALDTKRTGVNAPVKRATGGNRDILPLFDTMGQRTIQTFKAVAKNRFGVELKNVLGTTIENEGADLDEIIDSIDTQDGLLQEGKDGRNPTFTVFENGEKVTFEITEEMYDALKPKSKAMAYTNKVLNKVNNIRRGLITEYNPAFMLTNPIKDTQDVLVNSKHPAKTYANYPKAIAELIGKNGQYYQEYMENGGEYNTYFDRASNTFAEEKSGIKKVIGFPLEKISAANNFIERIPRMAEYIASRKMGRSIDVSMLDAARVTTDFSAGGDLVQWANRNGFTFLNASVQGAVQQVRNVREAKANGLKGWAQLAAKVTAAGLPAILLNHLLWDDDEEYAELSDYVKQNYYIVGKYGDGQFVRIPKGRTLAVIQNAFEQMENLVTGNDEVDLATFGELVVSNLAPNNPAENNIIAPIKQALNNETWYGGDLVPTRLQDLPAAEQYDESTDSISKWLGEKINISPYKINYVLDQYSGAIGDMFLPMLTPEAERGDDSLLGNMIAPLKSKFTTDGVMNNQNVADFYDTKDELTMNANASGATDEDILMNKYMNSVNAELSKLYAEKREIQNSDLADNVKYSRVRGIQEQIIDLTRKSLNTYEDIRYEGDGEYAVIGDRYFEKDDEGEWQKMSDDQVTKYKVTSAAGDAPYATDGEVHYRWYEPDEDSTAEAGWRKLTDEQVEKQEEVTSGLDITPEEYWGNKEEYDYAYEHPENYAVAKSVGGYEAYRGYSSEIYDIKADKDSSGKSISGSRKEKVADYISGLGIDDGMKYILFKNEYNADDTYNYEIIEYLNSREDISFEEEVTILKKLGFEVDSKGNVTWD